MSLEGNLRKRTTTMSHARDKSPDPTRPPPSVIPESDEGWDDFKETVYKHFPDVTFPDEYVDNNIVSASVSGVYDVCKFAAVVMDKALLKIQDGRLIIEYDIEANGVLPGTTPPSKNTMFVYILLNSTFWVFIIWFILIGLTGWFVTANHEKYMRLLWNK
jgi:hypothetical protein